MRPMRPTCQRPVASATSTQQRTPLPATSLRKSAKPLVVQELRGADVKTVLSSGVVQSPQTKPVVLDQVEGPQPSAASAATADYSSPPQEKAVAFLKSLFLPEGYPATTTPDYLPYQLWATPTHILGAVAHALTTSSLLQAVGFSAGPVATTAASAAIKWITKDGIGAFGRFLVGGSLSQEFDKDPRRWRMVAELCTSTGAGLEIATAAFPQHFLVLACLGRLLKASAKAMGKPVFRVIQTHFALDNNVGAVAAKEEVWEVVAQLTGYAVSLGVLTAVDALIKEQGGVSTGTELVAIWAAVQSTHIVLRYQSLRCLVFKSLNDKRGIMIMADHVAGRQLRSVEEVNRTESFLPAHVCLEPRMHLGTASLTELFETVAQQQQPPDRDVSAVAEQLLGLYEGEEYVLVWREGEAVVVFQENASHGATLRAMWQACWLHRHHASTSSSTSPQSHAITSGNGHSAVPALHGNGSGKVHAAELSGLDLLAESVSALQSHYPDFEKQAQALGWDTSAVLVGFGAVRFRTL